MKAHPNVLDMTPREIQGWLGFHAAVEKREKAEALHLHALAAQGDNKQINKTIKELAK